MRCWCPTMHWVTTSQMMRCDAATADASWPVRATSVSATSLLGLSTGRCLSISATLRYTAKRRRKYLSKKTAPKDWSPAVDRPTTSHGYMSSSLMMVFRFTQLL